MIKEKERKLSLKHILYKVKNKIKEKFKRKERTIEIELPKGFMNCGISVCNKFIADTNDSSNWDTVLFPLPKPKGKWEIKCYTGDIDNPLKRKVILVDV